MNKEPKACPLCGKQPQGNNWHTYGRNPKDEMRYFCANASCPGGFRKTLTLDNWNTRPIEDALRAELAASQAEVERLNNLLADAISAAREGVVELLDALHADEITQQEVIDSFRQYLLGNAETRICSYCGLLMSGDKAQQMTSHVMQCASNPLVQEIARLKAEKLECIKSLEYFVNRMQEERTERIRLEERLKLANATIKSMAEDSGYDSEEASDGQAQ